MENLKTSVRRFFYRVRTRWLVFDNLTLIICVILCIWWTYGSIMAMTRNWNLSRTLADKERELALVTLEVETLELENEYYRSEEYQELSARAKIGKKLEGEFLVYLPENSEYAITKHQKTTTDSWKDKSNISQWFDFLF